MAACASLSSDDRLLASLRAESVSADRPFSSLAVVFLTRSLMRLFSSLIMRSRSALASLRRSAASRRALSISAESAFESRPFMFAFSLSPSSRFS